MKIHHLRNATFVIESGENFIPDDGETMTIEATTRTQRHRLRQTVRDDAYERCAGEAQASLWEDLEGEDFESR